VAALHAEVLDDLRRTGCMRLGLHLASDSYDYPLTWRAMALGVRVRHVLSSEDWPCAIFGDLGAPPVRPDGRPWLPTGIPGYVTEGAPGMEAR
jgi:hypothetical protein